MELSGKRVAIFIENKYQEFEFWYPYFRMKEAGAKVTIVGTGAKEFLSGNNIPAPHPLVRESGKELISAEAARAADFDGLIVPGGFAPDYMRRNEEMLRLVREMHQAGKVVATICHAGWVLVSAGILKGKKATCLFSIKDDVINAGAHYLDQEVVRDGNLITSRWPDDLPVFCRTIIAALRGE